MADADVIVVGLGAMGSAAAYRLARRGRRVLGIDRFAPPHPLGSTHGESRIIREAYFEHPDYVPLVQRAFELWGELEHDAQERLYLRTGGLMIGPRAGMIVGGALSSAERHRLAVEELSRADLARRFPAFRIDADDVAILERRAGVLFPERCVSAALRLAAAAGATLNLGETVLHWRAVSDGVEVRTNRATYHGGALVLSAGPWAPALLRDVDVPLQVERQLFHWFRPRLHAEQFDPARCPVTLWEFGPGRLAATFPDLGTGVKIGVHHEGVVTTPDRVDRTVSEGEDNAIRVLLARLLPDCDGPPVGSRVCLYTNTPDRHFVLDLHPDHPQVVIASPCSGHGFKFASVVGEIVADLATERRSAHALEPFRVGRFPPGAQTAGSLGGRNGDSRQAKASPRNESSTI